MSEQPAILAEDHGGYTIVSLNRPEKLNSFNRAMHLELREALTRAAEDETCRAVLLTGAGRGFCAGQDLSERDFSGPEAPDLSQTLNELYNPLIRLIRTMGKPVIAAVNGVAAGAGANLALACDIVIAARSARFIQSFTRIGLIPDAGGTWTLPRLVGEARARAISILAEPVSAEQAASWGMIWEVSEDGELMDRAEAMCRELAARPTRSFALLKEAYDLSATNDLAAQLAVEARLQAEAGRTADYRIGVEAFRAKETPRFTGR